MLNFLALSLSILVIRSAHSVRSVYRRSTRFPYLCARTTASTVLANRNERKKKKGNSKKRKRKYEVRLHDSRRARKNVRPRRRANVVVCIVFDRLAGDTRGVTVVRGRRRGTSPGRRLGTRVRRPTEARFDCQPTPNPETPLDSSPFNASVVFVRSP